jgi:hypothetical protein
MVIMFNFLEKLFRPPVEKPREPRMYILVREDLNPIYRCVQGGHALAAYAAEYPGTFQAWGNQYLMYLGVRNHTALAEWYRKIQSLGKEVCLFTEPDLDGQLTAIACYDTGEIFQDLKLTN